MNIIDDVFAPTSKYLCNPQCPQSNCNLKSLLSLQVYMTYDFIYEIVEYSWLYLWNCWIFTTLFMKILKFVSCSIHDSSQIKKRPILDFMESYDCSEALNMIWVTLGCDSSQVNFMIQVKSSRDKFQVSQNSFRVTNCTWF
jgi:hypothetical protein